MPGPASVKTSVLISRTHIKLDTIACTSIGKWEVNTKESQGACEARSFIEKRGSYFGVSGVQREHLLGSVMASSKKIDNRPSAKGRYSQGKAVKGEGKMLKQQVLLYQSLLESRGGFNGTVLT